jgi:hypothetical protein
VLRGCGRKLISTPECRGLCNVKPSERANSSNAFTRNGAVGSAR